MASSPHTTSGVPKATTAVEGVPVPGGNGQPGLMLSPHVGGGRAQPGGHDRSGQGRSLASLLDAAGIGLLEVNRAAEITDINAAALDLLTY